MSAPEPLRDVGRRLGARLAFAFAVLMQGLLGVVLLLPRTGLLLGLMTTAWVVGAAVLWRWRRAGLVLLAVPFATAGTWWVLASNAGITGR